MGYLRDVRAIDGNAIADVLERIDAIGWHPAVYLHEPGHELHGRRLGAIIGIMTDAVTGKPTGAISRTYLFNGKKVGKAKTLGSPAGIIRLDRDEDVLGGLHLGEGLETCLSAMALEPALRPCWSAGTAGAITSFPVLDGIERLTVFEERDEASAKAVEACARRWFEAGRQVIINEPIGGKDLNDALRSRRSA